VPNLPKALAFVNGRPFLSYLLDQLIEAEAQNVILCTGYQGELIKETFKNNYKDLDIEYSHERTQLGTGGALRNALDLIEFESVLVMNGDSYCGIDLKYYIDWSFNNKYNASLVLTKVKDTGRYGKVRIDNKGRIIGFEEKSMDALPGLINAGIYMFNRWLLKSIPPEIKFSIEQDFLPNLVNKELYGFCSDGKFIDIGTPESLIEAGEFFGKGQ